MASRVIVRQVRSTAGRPERQWRVLRALGLRRIGQEREHEDAPAIRGMIRKVEHLVTVRKAE